MNIQDDLDRALERLRATANRSLQNQTDLDTLLVGVIALRTEVTRLENELALAQGMLAGAMDAMKPAEEVMIPLDYRVPFDEQPFVVGEDNSVTIGTIGADPGIEVGATTHPAESGVPFDTKD